MTTLFDAIEHGDLRTLRKIMRSGESLGLIDEASGVTPLALAAEGGRLDVVKILLRAGAGPDWGGATTPLEATALEGHVHVAEALIRAGADVQRPVADGFTPLITAAATGNLEMVQLLLEAGAHPMIQDDEGESALTLAKKKGHKHIVEALKVFAGHDQSLIKDNGPHKDNGKGLNKNKGSNKSNGSDQDGAESLFEAIHFRDLAGLKKLLADPTFAKNLENPDTEGWTALSRAAHSGHVALVQVLLEAGADINGGARTPLYCAAENRFDPVVNLLLEEGADVNKPCAVDNATPIMAAAASGHIEIVRLLLEAGADTRAVDANKKDALWHAASAGQEQTFALVLPLIKVAERKSSTSELAAHVESRRKMAQGAARLTDHIHAGELDQAKSWIANGLIDPDGFDEEGRTALMLAARLGRRDLMRLLIAAGASFEPRDDTDGHTALIHSIHSPVSTSHLTVSLLAAAGADVNRPSTDGRTPLMHAIDRFLMGDDEDIQSFSILAEPLFHAGARVDEPGSDGLTAWDRILERAMQEEPSAEERRKLTRLRRILEKYGADTQGATSLDLMAAVAEGLTGRLRELLSDLQIPDDLGDLPLLSVAAAHDQWEVVSQLVSAGVDINTPNSQGQTILMQAAEKGTLPMVEQLVHAGADAKIKNSAGQIAAALARSQGHHEVADFLKSPT